MMLVSGERSSYETWWTKSILMRVGGLQRLVALAQRALDVDACRVTSWKVTSVAPSGSGMVVMSIIDAVAPLDARDDRLAARRSR